MKDWNQKQQQQQQWLREHTLTWTQTKRLIESKLERARRLAGAIKPRETLAKSR
jgi:hypothetical protein